MGHSDALFRDPFCRFLMRKVPARACTHATILIQRTAQSELQSWVWRTRLCYTGGVQVPVCPLPMQYSFTVLSFGNRHTSSIRTVAIRAGWAGGTRTRTTKSIELSKSTVH